MTALSEISADLDWREGGLATLRILLKASEKNDLQKQVLLRAAWALLYAHLEGYVKFCLTVFYDEVKRRGVPCVKLPRSTLAFALKNHISGMRNSTSLQFAEGLLDFPNITAPAPATFPEVDTKSNLRPNVLIELLEAADICVPAVARQEIKLKTLVARRNGIAHGEQSFIKEIEYYLTYEEAV